MPNNYKSATRYFGSGSKSAENLQGYRYPIFAATGISPILTFCSGDTGISFFKLPVSLFKMWNSSGIPVSHFSSYRYLWRISSFFLCSSPGLLVSPSLVRCFVLGSQGSVAECHVALGTRVLLWWNHGIKNRHFHHFSWNYQKHNYARNQMIKAMKCMRVWHKREI